MRKAILVLVAIIVTLAIVIPVFFLMDSDGDGLSNLDEILLGTDFGNPDTDGDGLSDGLEVNGWWITVNGPSVYVKSNPLSVDSDEDNLNDWNECHTYFTNPNSADTDDDNLADKLELDGWSITVNNQTQHVASNPLSSDSDGDSLNDWDEYHTHHTNPDSTDTDNDGLLDGPEISIYGTNPSDNDTDNDRLLDGLEVSGWSITVNDVSHDISSDPLSKDSDGDNLSDWVEYNTYLSDPRATDTDGDGLSDLLEVLYNTDLFDASSVAQQIENAPAYPRLYLEIDYMSGHAPAPEAISYIESYFEHDLGVVVEVIQDEITNSKLAAIGVSPESISIQELVLIESQSHDNPTTHLYVFYANELEEEEQRGGLAREDYGAALNGKYLPERLDRERTILLHEVGHCLGLEHCDNSTCAMQVVVIFENPIYCSSCWSQRDLLDIWSVDEPWI